MATNTSPGTIMTSSGRTFRFRLLFRARPAAIDSDAESIEIPMSDGRIVRFAPEHKGTTLRSASKLVLISGGFATAEEARVCGERVRNAVRLSMVELKTGFDLGKDTPGLQTDEDLKESVFRTTGEVLHDPINGLQVYAEQPPPTFLGVSASLVVSYSLNDFITAWQRQYDIDATLTEREALALELYAVAQAESSMRARLVALATVVEVLAAGTTRTESAQRLIESWIDRFAIEAKNAGLDESEHTALSSGLANLKRQSISSTCRRYVDMVLGKVVAKDFIRLYGIRCDIVHSGVYDRSDLGDDLTRLGSIVTQLLAGLGVGPRGNAA